jgi:AraC-like DNA-binding protein
MVKSMHSRMEKDTVSIHFVAAALARLKPATQALVLARAGIARQWLAHPEARVTAEAFAALWLAVAQEEDDEFFGLDSRRMKVGSFALLCHAVLHAGTLGRAVRQLLRGFAALLDDVGGELQTQGQEAVLVVRNRVAEPQARQFADETFLVMVHGLMCWLAGRRIPILAVDFAHDRPAHAAEYGVMFSPQVSFGAAATSIRFESRWLAAAIAQDNESLGAFLRTAPQSVFLKYRNEQGWAARVRRRMRAVPAGQAWPTLFELAAEFQITGSTLRRHLEREGCSYQGLKDQLRRDAAIGHLAEGSRSVGEVGLLLGFREASAFHRAFKKWTGVSPGQYGLRAPTLQPRAQPAGDL